MTWEDEQESEPTSSAGDSTESSEGEDGVSDGEDERLGSVIRFSHSKLPVSLGESPVIVRQSCGVKQQKLCNFAREGRFSCGLH